MKNKNILITFIVLATIVTSCMNEEIEGLYNSTETTTESSSVITFTTDAVDGIMNLSIDAPESKRSQLWIDLNGDGVRAEDGTEDISAFNQYQDYILAPELETVRIYGDITYLAGASNDLTGIDISRNPYLTTLNAPLNQLTTIDVSNNQALNSLDVSDNNLTTLNVSHNSELTSLWVFNNLLSELNLSNNSNLLSIDCSSNRINQLDVTQNTQLIRLVCYNNQLTSLDIAQNSKLNRLWLFGNPFSDQEITSITNDVNAMSTIDLWITDVDDM